MKIIAMKTKIHMRINLINYYCVLYKYYRVFKKNMINILLLIYNLCLFFRNIHNNNLFEFVWNKNLLIILLILQYVQMN